MGASVSVSEGKKMSGKWSVFAFGVKLMFFSGAYCAMVMISLLDLPLELPLDCPARVNENNTFVSGLPEYLSRCE